MKKILFPIVASLALCACGNKASEQQEPQLAADSTEVTTSGAPDMEKVKAAIADADFYSNEGMSRTELKDVMKVDDSTYIAVIREIEVYDPNASLMNGHFGINDKMECTTGFMYVRCVISMEDGKAVIRNDKRILRDELPGNLGKSEAIWSSDEAKRKIVRAIGHDFMFGYPVDVDGDGIFEFYTFNTENGESAKTALLTLADANGNIDGLKHMSVAIVNLTDYYPIQVDMDRHQVFWRGGTGGANLSEVSVDIRNSHPTKRWEYLKEVNPDDQDEYEESCNASSPSGKDVKGITVEEYRKNCGHGNNIFTQNATLYSGVE